jgi:hypothetical protein
MEKMVLVDMFAMFESSYQISKGAILPGFRSKPYHYMA